MAPNPASPVIPLPKATPPVNPSLLALSAICLGLSLNVREGLFNNWAILLLTLALACCISAVFPFSFGRRFGLRTLPTASILIAGIALQLLALFFSPPGTVLNARWLGDRPDVAPLSERGWQKTLESPEPGNAALRHKRALARANGTGFANRLLAVAAVAMIAGVLFRKPSVVLAIAIVGFLVLGVLVLRVSRNPYIDVYVFQQESCKALLAGQNPYAIRFPNIYGPDAFVYGQGLKAAEYVNFGYPYPPITLLMALPGYLIAGDHRYSQLVAFALAALLIALLRPGIVATLAAVLLLFSPRSFMLIELAWTEPFVILLLALTIYCAVRFPRAMPYALGLLLAGKQYLVFAVPLVALLVNETGRAFWRQYAIILAKAFTVALLVSAPLVLWDLPAFIHSAVTLQLHQPFRNDALSYLAWLWWLLNKTLPDRFGLTFAASLGEWPQRLSGAAFVAAIAAIVAALRRCPRCPGGFVTAIAVTFYAFLVVNKQAFCNYYFLVLAALCCAIALLALPVEMDRSEGDQKSDC